MSTVEDLSEQAGSVLGTIEGMLDEGTVGSVQGSARELQGLLTELSDIAREQRGALANVTESLTRAAEGIESASEAGPEIASAAASAAEPIGGGIVVSIAVSLDASLDALWLSDVFTGEAVFSRSGEARTKDRLAVAARRREPRVAPSRRDVGGGFAGVVPDARVRAKRRERR